MKKMNETWLFQQLKGIYGSEHLILLMEEHKTSQDHSAYVYIPVKEGLETIAWIGISREKIGQDAEQLLYLLGESPPQQSGLNAEEAFWQRAIRQDQDQWLDTWASLGYTEDQAPFGVAYLYFSQSLEDGAPLLGEWVKGVLEIDSYLISVDERTYAWVVPSFNQFTVDFASMLRDLVGTLTAELMLEPRMLIGEPFYMPIELRAKVKQELRFLQYSVSFSWDQQVAYVQDILDFILLGQVSDQDLHYLIDQILGEVRHDQELIQTIETLLAENLNVSEAAKKLYIHRNSMQYRLDKFSEKTSLDARKFEDAYRIHLAIQALGKLNKK